MIPVHEAVEIALQEAQVLTPELVSLDDVGGYVLAEDIYSDIDMPPFDKSAMDGYAVRANDVEEVPATLDIVGFIPAGIYPDFEIGPGQAAQIMTGAPMPTGSDSVQMVEKTEKLGKEKVRILEAVTMGKHVAKRSEVMTASSMICPRGTYVSPALAGVLATVGRHEVRVYKRPQVGILVTGDELVAVSEKPRKGQIRNSNGYVLFNQVKETGCVPVTLGVVSDDMGALTERIEAGLRLDVLLITGGVSMGELDLVEDVFDELGVKVFYNKVNIKPGKPTVFGRKNEALVFGLPGNPVSASTVFDIIVRPVLRKMLGFEKVDNVRIKAKLTSDLRSKTGRENYVPARVYFEDDELVAAPISSKGSADVLAYARGNAYVVVPGDLDDLERGREVVVVLREEFWKASA